MANKQVAGPLPVVIVTGTEVTGMVDVVLGVVLAHTSRSILLFPFSHVVTLQRSLFTGVV